MGALVPKGLHCWLERISRGNEFKGELTDSKPESSRAESVSVSVSVMYFLEAAVCCKLGKGTGGWFVPPDLSFF